MYNNIFQQLELLCIINSFIRFIALYINIREQNAKVCHLRTLSFETEKLSEYLDYIKERMNLTRIGNRPTATVQITGVGTLVLGKIIAEKLQVAYVFRTFFFVK